MRTKFRFIRNSSYEVSLHKTPYQTTSKLYIHSSVPIYGQKIQKLSNDTDYGVSKKSLQKTNIQQLCWKRMRTMKNND